MKHSELIDAGGAVKYEGQDVPEWAAVGDQDEAMQHADNINVRQCLSRLARSLDESDDVMYVFNWNKARKAARKEIGL